MIIKLQHAEIFTHRHRPYSNLTQKKVPLITKEETKKFFAHVYQLSKLANGDRKREKFDNFDTLPNFVLTITLPLILAAHFSDFLLSPPHDTHDLNLHPSPNRPRVEEEKSAEKIWQTINPEPAAFSVQMERHRTKFVNSSWCCWANRRSASPRSSWGSSRDNFTSIRRVRLAPLFSLRPCKLKTQL